MALNLRPQPVPPGHRLPGGASYMRTLLLDDDNQLVRAPFLLFVSTILLLAGGLYGELYGRPYHNKVLSAGGL